jgi:hypothetical protein
MIHLRGCILKKTVCHIIIIIAGAVCHMLIGSIYRFVKMLRKAFERYMLNHVELSTHDEVTMLCM